MDYNLRFSFGFYNPNHAAALVCAIVPLCWGWMRYVWLGRVLFVLLCVMLALTQSRTGLIVLVLEMSAWWVLKLRNYNSGLSKRWVRYVFCAIIVGFMLWRTFKRLENIFTLCVMAYVFMTKYLRGSKRFKKIVKLLGEIGRAHV